MQSSGNHNAPPSHEEIATCAFLIWIREGYPEGRDKQHWYQAESQLAAMRAHDGWTGETDRAAHHTMSE